MDAIALAAYAEQLLPRGEASVCCVLPCGIVWTHLKITTHFSLYSSVFILYNFFLGYGLRFIWITLYVSVIQRSSHYTVIFMVANSMLVLNEKTIDDYFEK